jgi:hypothetical protein
MRRGSLRRARLLARCAVAFAGASTLLILCATVALADCGDTAAAVVQGQWQVDGTTTYTGSVPSTLKGRQGTDQVFFTSTCTGPQACALLPGSPSNHTNLNSVAFEGSSGLIASGPLTQSGSDYSAHYPDIGFGGPSLPPCSPPILGYTLHIHVAVAVKDATGTWQPTYITGTEDSLGWWTCSGGVGVSTGTDHVVFKAVPTGHSFPSSVAALCAPPSSTAAAVVAGSAAPSTQNPQQSTISTALTPPASAFKSLGHAVGNALITLGIVLFITFPATLFNKTLEENYDDIRDIAKRRFGLLARLARRVAADRTPVRDATVFGLVVLVGSALGGLNDPHFGFNMASLLTYTAVIVAVLFGVGVSTLVGYIYRRARRLDTGSRLTALPAGLAVAAACVLVSRLTQFQPGYLYGIVCGVAFAATLQRDENGHVVALSSAVTLALGVVAWFLWVPVRHSASVPGASPLTVIAGDFLAAVFVGGLVGTVLNLVPLRFLPGGELLQWKRAVWGTFFGLAVFGLLQVMLRPESSAVHTGTTAVVTAGVLFVLFGGVSVATRLYFGRRRRRRAEVAAPA